MPPPTLGRYRIVKELGRGAMGRVFLAHDPRIDRNVAIKTIQIFDRLSGAEGAEARRRFLQEARVAGKLAHPGIVTVFDVDEADGVPYLAMEYIEGTPLDAFARPGNLLPVKLAVEIVAQAAGALAYAHERGVVHRDVKPANLMRVGDAVKIMDFGLAAGAGGHAAREGALLGTPSFMSPEQIRGEALDGRSDLFSLAAVLYQLLTGEKAFAGETVSSILFRVVHEDPREASVIADRVSGPLSSFLQRALAKRPDERFPDGGAFAAALHTAVEGAGSEIVPSEESAPAETPATAPAQVAPVPERGVDPDRLPPPRAPRSSPRRRSTAWIVALVVLLAGAAGAAFVYREPIRAWWNAPPPERWLEAAVLTDPPGLPVTLDGVALEQAGVRFRPDGPFGTLAATLGCRTVSRTLSAADAGTEIVLVPEPTEVRLTVDPGVEGAQVRLNGADAGTAPVSLALDLCRDNRIEASAAGFRPSAVDLASGATPMQARTSLAGLRLVEVPRGTLVLGAGERDLKFFVDGRRVRSGQPLPLTEGRYKVRAVNEALWIDVTQTVEVRGGTTVRPEIDLPGIADLVVQAFPANCEVYLRRKGGSWRLVDETPLRGRIAAGTYEVKVQLKTTGASRTREVTLRPGENPPVRVSFGRGA